MASISKTKMKSTNVDPDYEVDSDEEEEELEKSLRLDYEPEKVIAATFDSLDDPFLTNLCIDHSEFVDGISNDGDGDDDIGHLDDDENDIGGEVCVYNPNVEWNLMVPRVGEKYASMQQLKMCLVNYAVANGYPLHFEKLERSRLVVRCGRDTNKKKCTYCLHASWMLTERTVQVKSIKNKHSCSRTFVFGHLVSPELIALKLMRELILNPTLKLKQMVEMIHKKYKYVVSKSKFHREKQRAFRLIDGKLSDHYARIWDYGAEVLRSNRGSTVQVSVNTNPDGKHYFHRFYVCFHALKIGWISRCRRVIGLDGCFLKGVVKGELLSAIGRDANNQVYPICWTVVDIENKQNWRWFLELLSQDLGLQDGGGVTVISDQHKGLLEAVKEIIPQAEHRQCSRHIYANFKKSYNGEEYKKLFWAASSCTVEVEFKSVMERLKDVNAGAYDYLMRHDPQSWCRAYFFQDRACEAFENGVSESFNAMIVDARKRPMLTILEMIRLSVMERVCVMNKEEKTWDGPICPSILTKLDEFGEKYTDWSGFQ